MAGREVHVDEVADNLLLEAGQGQVLTLRNGRIVLHGRRSIQALGAGGTVVLQQMEVVHSFDGSPPLSAAPAAASPASEHAAINVQQGCALTLDRCSIQAAPSTTPSVLLRATDAATTLHAEYCTLHGGRACCLVAGGARASLDICSLSGYGAAGASGHAAGVEVQGRGSSARLLGCRLAAAPWGVGRRLAGGLLVSGAGAAASARSCSFEGHTFADVSARDASAVELHDCLLGLPPPAGPVRPGASVFAAGDGVRVAASGCTLHGVVQARAVGAYGQVPSALVELTGCHLAAAGPHMAPASLAASPPTAATLPPAAPCVGTALSARLRVVRCTASQRVALAGAPGDCVVVEASPNIETGHGLLDSRACNGPQ